MKTRFLLLLALALAIHGAQGASTNFLETVRRYADAMIERGRDTYGPQKSGLLLSALDRTTLGLLQVRPAPPGGIRRGDRPGRAWVEMNGANPMLDQNLLRVFYTLSAITGDARYAHVADEELTWFFNHTMSPKTGLLPWGEHLSWDVVQDVPISGGDEMMHEFARPWMLWERCFALAPEASTKYALGLWEHQIANHTTGGFDRHAPCASTDMPIHGLLTDLKRRGLWDSTLVIWGGEFGRMPVSQGNGGRDHNPNGFMAWMAGAGIKGGTSYGETDEIGYKAVKDRVSVHDLHATMLHLLGMDHEKLTYFHNGRRYRLTDVAGEVIEKILV